MCVGFEGELVEVTGSGLTRSGILQVDDRRFPIGLTFVPEAQLGDRVVAHTGQAVRVVASHLPIQGH